MKNYNSVFNLSRYGYVRWWEIPKQIKRLGMICKAIYQRSIRGFDNNDICDLDKFLCEILADSIYCFRTKTVSYPAGMTFKEWNAYLMNIEFLLRWANVEEDEATKSVSEEFYRACDKYGPESEESKKCFKEMGKARLEFMERRKDSLSEALDRLKNCFFDLWI